MNIRRSPNDKKLSPIKKKTKQKTYLNLVEFPFQVVSLFIFGPLTAFRSLPERLILIFLWTKRCSESCTAREKT